MKTKKNPSKNQHLPPPPKAARWLLHRWGPARRQSEMADDLDELFRLRTARLGPARARRRYWRDVLSICARRSLRTPRPPLAFPYETARGPIMLANYLKITLRNLRKHKVYTVLNVAGLAVGLACCLLILRFVQHELSYDRFHEHADRIYRVATEQQANETLTQTVNTPLPLAEALVSDFPEVRHAIRLGRAWTGAISYNDRQFHESELYFADPGVFDVFSLELVRGAPESALQAPNSIVLTEEMAHKYFGAANPLGKVLTFTFEGSQEFEVTGVVKALPPNAHFHFDFLISPASQPRFLERMGLQWDFNFRPTYVLLADEHTAASLENQLPAFVQRHFPDELRDQTSLSLQPLTDLHLHSHLQGELEPNGSVASLFIFSGIALLILLLACINFMNLATARSATRAREVGLRKVLGAFRGHLIGQFLGEAVLLSSLAVLLAVGLAALFIPLFNSLTGTTLTLLGSGAGWLPGILVLLALFVGILAGSYPAFFLSAFQPARVLKGTLLGPQRAAPLRKILVVGQFVVTIFFLIGIGVMHDQLRYLRTKELGYAKDQLVYIRSPQRMEPTPYEAFKNELTRHPDVLAITGASAIPGSGQHFWTFDARSEDQRQAAAYMTIHPDFIETYQVQWSVAGNLARASEHDSTATFLINETAARVFQWENAALDQELTLFFGNNPEPFETGRVLGVLSDFHFESLHTPVRPIVLRITPRVHTWTYLALRLRSDNLPETLAHIEATWQSLAPEWPLDLSFLDERFGALYEQEARLGQTIGYFTLLAIFIACLGLFGLAAFTAEQRTKEIGVRKVLGASVTSIVLLLSKDFTSLVLVAFALATPLAYLAMERWLNDFAYRIDLSWEIFLLAGSLSLAIALLTISYQSIRAALTDPVQSLRYE